MKKQIVIVLLLVAVSFLSKAQEPIGDITDDHIIEQEGYQIGESVEDFHLMGVDGEYVGMANYPDAKGFIIIFTCNHCPYSQAYENRIMELNNTYQGMGYPVIAINPNDPNIEPDDSYEEMQNRAHRMNYQFPYLWDEEQTVYPLFGATRTPEVYIVTHDGDDYILRYKGAIDNNTKNPDDVTENYVVNALSNITAGVEVEVPETKAIGCSIKTDITNDDD